MSLTRKQAIRNLNELVACRPQDDQVIQQFSPEDWREYIYPEAVALQKKATSKKEVCFPEEIWELIKDFQIDYNKTYILRTPAFQLSFEGVCPDTWNGISTSHPLQYKPSYRLTLDLLKPNTTFYICDFLSICKVVTTEIGSFTYNYANLNSKYKLQRIGEKAGLTLFEAELDEEQQMFPLNPEHITSNSKGWWIIDPELPIFKASRSL